MQTMADTILHARRNFGDSTALICGNVRLDYRSFYDRCCRLGGLLESFGLEAGDRVAILAANSHQYIETYMGVPSAGFVVVPLNTRHSEAELHYALADSGARVLLTDRDPGALADLVERVVRLPDEYEDLLPAADPVMPGEGVGEDQLAGLFYTGGTTGASKGVMLSHRNLVANAFHWLPVCQAVPEDVVMIMAPLFHAAGTLQVMSTLWTGGALLIVPEFVPAMILDLMETEGVTQNLGVPTMLAALVAEQFANPRDMGALRKFYHGASPISTEALRRAHQAFPGCELVHVYGATETAPLVTAMRHEQERFDSPRIRSCGQAVTGVTVRVVDNGGNELPPGEVGEVVIRGPNVMLGYWNKPEQTAEALKDGWYFSGDLGYADENGFLFLVDRAKDMIISGGENVYCTEVEEVLYQHPCVREAAVFAIPDDTWGEAVHAAVVLSEPAEVEDLIEFCRERIAHYKVPRGIDIREEPLPLSGPGKVLKRELRAPYWKGHEEQIS